MNLKDLQNIEIKTEYFKYKFKTKEKLEYMYSIIDKDFLTDCIVINEWSMLATVNFLKDLGFNTSVNFIKSRCIVYNIPTPSFSEGCLRSAAKRQDTNLKRFGAINSLSKGTLGYEKRNKTVLDKYGVTNVFANQEIIDKLKKTNLERYGVEYPVRLLDHQNNFSKPHQVVSNYLNSINIIHSNEERNLFIKFNEDLNKIYNPIPDIYIKDLSIVIEVYGDYWHGNPKIYKKDDLVPSALYDRNLKTIKDIWDKDLIRQKHIESFGNKVFILWESEIINNKYIEKINEWLELN